MHIDPQRLQLSLPADMQIDRPMLGDGRYPALVIDNFYRSPEHVRELALGLHYRPPGAKHPGYVAMASLPMEPILEFLYACVADFYFPNLDSLLRRAHPWTFYRCEPAGLRPPRPVATMPHTDRSYVAGVVYLNLPDQCRGGTGFYRHVEAGTETVLFKDVIAGREPYANVDPATVARMKDLGAFEPFLRWKEAGRGDSYDAYSALIHNTPGTDAGFIGASAGGWELSRVLEMKYNRLVLFPAFALHALHYRPEWFGHTPQESRLTQNFFLDWPERAAT